MFYYKLCYALAALGIGGMMSRMRKLHVRLISVGIVIILFLYWGLNFHGDTMRGRWRNLSDLNTSLSPVTVQVSKSSVHHAGVNPGDDLQAMIFNWSSRDRYASRKPVEPNTESGLHNEANLNDSLIKTKPLFRDNQKSAYFSSSIYMEDYCVGLIQGNANQSLMKWAVHHRPIEEEKRQYMDVILRGCDDFLSAGDYLRKPLNSQEESFPIAYAIVMYKDPEQMERLLHAIYRPQNHYCIHVDSKVSELKT